MSSLPHDTDPYLAGRREWADRYADLATGKRNWQRAFAAMTAMALMLGAADIIQLHQARWLPYLVQMDPTGAIVTMVPQLTPTSQVIDLQRIEVAVVSQFVRYARSAIDDPAGERTLLQWVNAHMSGDAAHYVGSYTGENNPGVVAHKHDVVVTVTSIVPLAPHSWQVRFVERYLDHNGQRVQDMPDGHFVALLHTRVATDLGDDMNCPEGIKVVTLRWASEHLPGANVQ